jgi:hypothetical protein
MKKILMTGLGVVAATLLMAQERADASNPSFTSHSGGAINQVLNVQVRSPLVLRVQYDSLYNPFAVANQHETIDLASIAFGNAYFTGTGIQCKKTGLHATGWLGPFTAANQGASASWCSFTDSTDLGSSAFSGAWYAHICAAGENPPAPHKQVVNGTAFCTTGAN